MITFTKDGETTQVPEGHSIIAKLLAHGWVQS
jgi:hypothetical protein